MILLSAFSVYARKSILTAPVSSHYLTAAGMNLKKCPGAFCALWRAIGALLTPPKHHLRKNHANIPGGGRRMRTELGKRKLEGVSQQLPCP